MLRNEAVLWAVQSLVDDEVPMVTPVMHRKWAREYLARAEQAPDRTRKLQFLRLAVSNSVRAQRLEAEVEGSQPDLTVRKRTAVN